MRFKLVKGELENKLRFLLVPMEETESVVAMVLVKTGSRNESNEKLGISHVLEHMVFKGTEKYPTPLSLATTVDSLGADFNAFTGKEYTGFYIRSASEYIDRSLDVLAEMVLRPKLRQEDLEREKGVIIEEIRMYADQPRERVGEEFENLLFQGSNLGRLIIGSPETVQGVSSSGLREYMEKWYRGGNFLVMVAGKIDLPQVKAKLEELFSPALKGELAPYVDEGKIGSQKELFIEKKTEQTHFVLGVPGLSAADKRLPVEMVLSTILGGNMSSRLFVEVREKRGLAYYVGTVTEHFYDTGYLAARAGVKKEKYAQALEVVRNEMLNLADSLKKEEVEKAKKYLLGKIVLSVEDPMGIIRWFGGRLVRGLEVDQPDVLREKIKTVQPEEVQELAKELFQPDKLYLAVIR